MFKRTTAEEIGKAADEFGIEQAALLAVAEVESGGAVFAVIDGRQEPLIRFEGHYFDRRLSGNNLAVARAAGLASPNAGAVANPASQAARWRMLERAAAIDRRAAYESVSWGLGQVMGAHWKWLGFADVDALVAEARAGASGQARLIARYIEKAGLRQALQARDWEMFARGYNGPAYKRNAYHTKLAAAYRRHSAGKSPLPESTALPALLRKGSRSEAVRDLQHMLAALGYPLRADGVFGPETERAVRIFQSGHGLPADGIVGPLTREAIVAAMPLSVWYGRVWHWLSGLWRMDRR